MVEYQTDIFGGRVEVKPEETTDFFSAEGKTFDGNIFILTDAIGARDKRQAWVLYRKALLSGQAAEEIFWRVTWIVKSMHLASRTKDFTETDMKEFPYRKAKQFNKNFKEGELENISESLVVGYHNARRGLEEIELLLEKVILGL